VTLFLGAAQAIDLSKAHMCNGAMEVAQGACTVELDSDHAKLWSELQWACQALADADVAQSSLSADWEKLERECVGLHIAIDVLKEEEIQVLTDPEAAIAPEWKKF
jgi:hypothetical protein